CGGDRPGVAALDRRRGDAHRRGSLPDRGVLDDVRRAIRDLEYLDAVAGHRAAILQAIVRVALDDVGAAAREDHVPATAEIAGPAEEGVADGVVDSHA